MKNFTEFSCIFLYISNIIDRYLTTIRNVLELNLTDFIIEILCLGSILACWTGVISVIYNLYKFVLYHGIKKRALETTKNERILDRRNQKRTTTTKKERLIRNITFQIERDEMNGINVHDRRDIYHHNIILNGPNRDFLARHSLLLRNYNYKVNPYDVDQTCGWLHGQHYIWDNHNNEREYRLVKPVPHLITAIQHLYPDN